MTDSDRSALVPTSGSEKELDIFDVRPDLKERAEKAVHNFLSENTWRARRADWKKFCQWCLAHQVQSLPAIPATVQAYLLDCVDDCATSTIMRYAQSIAVAHQLGNEKSPIEDKEVNKTLRSIRREKGIRQKGREPFTEELLLEYLRRLSLTTLSSLRDRALLTFGLATAMRRSEIVAVVMSDLRWSEQGIIVTLRRSKTDQEGEGRDVALPYITGDPLIQPGIFIQEWLDASQIKYGPIFRGLKRDGSVRKTALNDREIGIIVKRAIRLIGGNPSNYGGHSLRVGYVTTARMNGLGWETIMEQTGHKALATVKRYSRFTPEIFETTHIAEVFGRSFRSRSQTKGNDGDR